MLSRYFARVAAVGAVALAALALTSAGRLRADTDSLDGPWATVHADLFGTAATTDIPYTLGSGPMEEKWRLDIVAEGHDRPGGRSSIVFDKDGNLYWISSTGGATGGVVRLVSASPEGAIRWFGNDGAGGVHAIGSTFSGASPVVGQARVYVAGDVAGVLTAAAYDKATGENLWETDLGPSGVGNNQLLTPILHEGKLYALGLNGGFTRDIHQVDAETGDLDGSSTIAEVSVAAVGQAAFVPNAFDAGVHGLYFNGASSNTVDGAADVYGIKISDGEATFGWASEGGYVARGHVIYSEATNRLYTLTWGDFGAQLYAFDPLDGTVQPYANSLNSGHGFYDVGCLGFDGETIVAGGFDGNIFVYSDDGATITDQVVYRGATSIAFPFWGETRVLGQLVEDPSGNSVLIAATNSGQCCASHVVAVDVTNKALLWEYDSGSRWDHQFLYAGGPLLGPDGKIYYFARPSDGTTALVALGPAASEPAPTAGMLLGDVNYAALDLAKCVKAGDAVRVDASCSIGKDVTYEFTADPPDGFTVVQDDPTSPVAELRFETTGTVTLTLTVANSVGDAECSQQLCVDPVQPRCSLTVTDSEGGPIDTAEDDDEIPCLLAGGTVLADASASSGGDLEFAYEVTPSEGVTIDRGGDLIGPRATMVFANAGSYTIRVTPSNSVGNSPCTKRICVVESDTRPSFRRGDGNADGEVNITDGIFVLNFLFLGGATPTCLEAANADDDAEVNITDGIYILNFLFLGGEAPRAPGPVECGKDPDGSPDSTCVEYAGC